MDNRSRYRDNTVAFTRCHCGMVPEKSPSCQRPRYHPGPYFSSQRTERNQAYLFRYARKHAVFSDRPFQYLPQARQQGRAMKIASSIGLLVPEPVSPTIPKPQKRFVRKHPDGVIAKCKVRLLSTKTVWNT